MNEQDQVTNLREQVRSVQMILHHYKFSVIIRQRQRKKRGTRTFRHCICFLVKSHKSHNVKKYADYTREKYSCSVIHKVECKPCVLSMSLIYTSRVLRFKFESKIAEESNCHIYLVPAPFGEISSEKGFRSAYCSPDLHLWPACVRLWVLAWACSRGN